MLNNESFEQLNLREAEVPLLIRFVGEQIADGALRVGVFGSRTVLGCVISEDSDIDLVIVKDGIQRGGKTESQGLFDITYVPLDYSRNKKLTFINHIIQSSVWIYGVDK